MSLRLEKSHHYEKEHDSRLKDYYSQKADLEDLMSHPERPIMSPKS